MHRRTVLSRYLDDLRELRRDLSISELQLTLPGMLYESIQVDEAEVNLTAHENRLYIREPFRRKISFMMQRIELVREGKKDIYDSDRFLADLQILANALEEIGYGDLVLSLIHISEPTRPY